MTERPSDPGVPSRLLTLLHVLGALLLASGAASAEDLDTFLKKLTSTNGEERRAAWEGAVPQGAAAVASLASLASGEDRDNALAALRAMDAIAHGSAAPGNAARKPVAAALAAILGDATVSSAVKRHVLDLLGSVGEDEVVPVIRKALQDSEIQDFARKALERIPGDASAKAILQATSGASGEWLDALLITLGSKRAACCVPNLQEIAASGGPGSIAAAKALARIADPGSVSVVMRIARSVPPPERGRLTDDLVRMGDLLMGRNPELARKIYSSILADAEDDGPRYAALHALASCDPKESLSVLTTAVGDRSPALRRLALEFLEKSQGTDVNKVLFDRLATSQGRQKAAILRVLAARKAPDVEGSIRDALDDPDLDVRVTALDLTGKLEDQANEATLVEAIEKGSSPVREVAVRAYLGMADARRPSDRKAAERMYLRVLDSAAEPVEKGRALVGLAATGNPEFLGRIREARKFPDLAQSANQACVAYAREIARAGKKDDAVEMLLDVVAGGASRETVQSALTALKDLGGDPTAYQKKQGLLASWWIVGPFPNEEGKGFDQSYSPEKEVNLKSQVDHKGRERKWVEYHSPNMDGKVDLRTVFQRSTEVCAYAYAEVEAPKAMDVRVKIGSDDGVVCWVNSTKIHGNNATRALSADQDVVDARLEAGVNRILLKVTQGGGEWEFMFRLTDREDRPLDLTKFKTPMKRE